MIARQGSKGPVLPENVIVLERPIEWFFPGKMKNGMRPGDATPARNAWYQPGKVKQVDRAAGSPD